VHRSVLLPNVRVGSNCRINKAIIDEGAEIPDNTEIGVDSAADRLNFHVTEGGVALVTPDMLAAMRLNGQSDPAEPRADLRSSG
jgi:glucose-1-phosphate adenylyltransferase